MTPTQSLYRTLLVTLLLLLASTATGANLTIEPDRDSITINDQLEVEIRLENGPTDTGIDLSPLERDFNIIGSGRHVESYTLNWEKQTFVVWTVALEPKRTGTLTIPALEVAGVSSQPREIEVTEAPSSAAESTAETFLTVEADKSEVYVQEQVLLTAKLYSKYDWSGHDLGNFELDNALIEALNEDQYVVEIDGTRHLVYEVTFALYPQKSGALTIPSLEYAVQLRTNNRRLLSFNSGPIRRGKSSPVSVNVLPIPEDNGADTWLPAKNLKLTQHFSHDPESLVAGEPITRRVSIEAEGLHPTQLPPIEFSDVEGYSTYADKAQTDERRSADGIASTRTETLAMVPSQAGRTKLPPLSLKWFNSQTGEYETATLPAVELRATMPTSGTGAAATPAAPPAQSGVVNAGPVEAVERIPLWLIVSQSVTGVLLVILLGLYWQSARRAAVKSERTAPEPSDQSSWKAVKRSAADNDLPALRRSLLQWACVHWDRPVNSLDALARLSGDTTIERELKLLDATIYGSNSSSFDSGELLPRIQKLRVGKRDQKSPNRPAPLYPA